MDISFWVLAVVAVMAALAVVLVRNVFRAAMLLALCFLTVAGLYITLSADFLAMVQVLIYVGAIGVLIVFAVMLTREVQHGSPSNHLRLPALVFGALLLVAMIVAVVGTNWQVATNIVDQPTTAGIAQALFDKDTGFVLPFEIASVLLLAALLGAIVLARDK
ncbi:MAG: NADH-quinone oxidoreductase subunit J [Chloroflexi bacterium]|nr:NADH-quinone oxidoreductase subunit J [Chloroflexota bacterium]